MTTASEAPDRRPARAGRRIIYLSKDVNYPTGGIRVAHRHVAMLVRNGFDARIVLVDDERRRFFEESIPVETTDKAFTLQRNDLIVVPEPWGGLIQKFRQWDVRRYVFCQNHFYTFVGLGPTETYAQIGVDRVFCCSEVIADYLKAVMGLDDVPVIHNAIDRSLFRPSAKRRQIAVMPRKMKIEADFIEGSFRHMYPDLADVPWVKIADVPEAEVARILGESAVFLALGRNEGLGLPPLEAMASGCLVVGFLGDGGRAFATPENGRWCAAEDWLGAAGQLAQALRDYDRDGGQRMIGAGRATASEYSLERMERELVAFWDAEIDR